MDAAYPTEPGTPPRPFQLLVRLEDEPEELVVAEGVLFSDGTTIMRTSQGLVVHDNPDDVLATLVPSEGTLQRVVWADESHTTVGYGTDHEHRLTWREESEQQRERISTLSEWYTIASNLDRCEHGRHEGDVCSSCGGPSKGNPLVVAAVTRDVSWDPMDDGSVELAIANGPTLSVQAGQVGYGLSGEPMVLPERERRNDPAAWFPGRDR